MTGEVASHVLQHNYDQTLSLSLLEMNAVHELDQHAQFMRDLEARGRLDRAVEGLPDKDAIEVLAKSHRALTRPELSVLLAYGKIDLFDDMIAGHAPDDPYFLETLEAYFPKGLEPYRDLMKRHRLRREIIATVVCNDIVNICGPTYPDRLRAAADCDVDALVIGYTVAKQSLRFDEIWNAVAALDDKAPAAAQMALFADLAAVLRAQTYWMARRAAARGATRGGVSIAQRSSVSAPAVADLRKAGPGILSPFEQKAIERTAKGLIKLGAPEALAREIAALRPLTVTADLADLARASSWSIEAVAKLHHLAGAALGFDKVRAAASALSDGDPFERLAVRRLIEDLLAEQTALTKTVMKFAGGVGGADDPKATLAGWSALNAAEVRKVQHTLGEIERAGGGWTFAKLTIANAALREVSGTTA